MRIRFSLRTPLTLVVLACAGLVFCRALLVRHFQADRDRDDTALKSVEEAFGKYLVVPRLSRGMATRATVEYMDFRVVREARRPRWAEFATLRLPNEVFLRTTQVVIGQMPSLSEAKFLLMPQGDDQPPELPPQIISALRREAQFADFVPRLVDWDFQRVGFEQARAAYRELSTLTELELLRPGILFGDADLALFREHPRLRALCLLPAFRNDDFEPVITAAGLLQLAEGFPALKFLIVEDRENGRSEGVVPESTIGKLIARRPDLHVARYHGALGLVWSTPTDPKTGAVRPITAEARREMDAAAELLDGIEDLYPKIRYPGDTKQAGGVF